jgi:hypothetical protein
VITVVRNRNVRTLASDDFVDLIAGTPVLSGSPVFRGRSGRGVTRTVQPGSYGVYQSKRLNYSRTYRGRCSGTIRAGQHRTCVVVNRQQELPAARIYDLGIAMAGPPVVATGAPVTWDIVVGNFGAATAPGVAVAYLIPKRFRFLEADLGARAELTRQASAVEANGPGCTPRARVVICRLGALQPDAIRTIHITARAPRMPGVARLGSATLGTNFEVRYANNIARTAVVVARSLACPPGSRLFDGACHPIVAGSG